MTLLRAAARLFAQAFIVTFAVLASITTIGVVLGFIAAIDGATGSEEAILASDYTHVAGDEGSPNRLLAIAIEGPILGHPPRDSFFADWGMEGIVYGYKVQQQLAEAAEDETVKGILLEVDTPGGTIFGSQAIFDGLESYRKETGRPIVAHVEGLAASGGVWAMVGADEIYADFGTGIGSIGVIGPMLTYYDSPTAFDGGLLGGGVTTERGISLFLVSAGRGKDFGNPFRKPTAEELAIAQKGVDRAYDEFVAHVAEARGIDAKKIRERIGAFLYGDEEAKQLGLIDGTLGRREAIAVLAEKAGVVDDYAVVRTAPRAQSLFAALFASFGGERPWSAARRASVSARELCGSLRLGMLAFHGDPRVLCASATAAAALPR
jgi:protease IV